MKKLLILGANPETVSLILKAKELGYYTIVTDYDPHAYAKSFADQAENVDAIDSDALIELALREHVDGVLVGVAEALLPTYCEVCKRLDLPCYSTVDKFGIMARKDYFKQKCREYDVPTIKEYRYDELEEGCYPVIVKPVDSCSSKGIRICYNKEDVENAIPYALRYSKSRKYLIEEYMVGDEVVSYYVMQEGTPIFVGMCDRYTYKEKGDLVQLPNSYIFPSVHIDSYINYTDAAVKKMIRGLGLENGSLFFQCIVDKEGIARIYESGYRLNGAQEHLLISRVSGIDVKKLYIDMAVNGKVSDLDLESMANPKPLKLTCKLSPLVHTGKIKSIAGLDEINRLPCVVSVNPSYREGDIVAGEGTLKQIFCRFYIVASQKKILKDTIDQIHNLLSVKDVNGQEMLFGLFDTSIIDDRY